WVTGGGGPGGGGRQRAKAEGQRAEGESGVRERAEATMGRRMAGGGGRPVPPGVAEALKGAAGVKGVVELRTIGASLDVRPGGRVLQGPPFRVVLARLPEDGMPFAVELAEGRWPEEGSGVCEVAANAEVFGTRVPKPGLGEEVPAIFAGGTVKLRVVGYYRMGTAVGAFPTMWGTGAAMRAVMAAEGGKMAFQRRGAEAPRFREGGGANLVLVEMENGRDAGGLVKVLEGAEGGRECALYTTRAVAERFRSDAVKQALGAMPLSLCMAALTAACLLATLAGIGVAARKRRIAVLRCAGMTRGGVARMLGCELGTVLAAGWVLGTLGAWAALQAFLWGERGTPGMPSAVHMGWVAWASGAALTALVGVAGGIGPLKSAMRVRPLDYRAREGRAGTGEGAWRPWAALALLVPLPALSMAGGIPEGARTWLAAGVGMPCFAAALWLGMGALMRGVEALAARPLGALLGLDGRLLQRRIGRDPRRVRGTVLTLALGLGGFAAVHIWGGTLMSSFVPSPEWPDAIASFLPNGLAPEEAEAASGVAGVRGGRCLRVDCTQKALETGYGAFEGREAPEGEVLFFGADPAAAFGGDEPLMRLRFVEGNREAALAAMEEGRGCVIVAMLSRLAGLHVGDRFRAGGRELEVSGVVDLNWHLVTSRALVRTRFGNEAGAGPGGRTVGMAFVSEKWARETTKNERTYFLWFDMDDELRAAGGLAAAERMDGRLRAVLGDDGRNAVRVHHRDEIADGTLAHGNDILGTMARIPLWSLAVTSTGIAALLAAGARGSKREFASMRAVGMTRSQLARLLLGEGLLIALAAVVLGLIGGTVAGWSFTGVSRWVAAAGLETKLIVPWATLGKGVAFALALCALMAAVPLWRIVKMVDE
ncbi:MAG: ABC transporter permease, partial [Kiritimatiellae bacterium]|nr:ABC transporter permease [Kiritimatiellia bacterium]